MNFDVVEHQSIAKRTIRLLTLDVLPAYETKWRLNRTDLACAVVMGAIGFVVSAICIKQFGTKFFYLWDIWFQADPIRNMDMMTLKDSELQLRMNVHPIYSSITYPLVHMLTLTGLDALQSARLLMTLCAGLSCGLLYIFGVAIGLSRVAALIFTGMFISSAAFIHWFAIVESYAFASVTILSGMTLIALSRPAPLWVWTVMSAATLAITTTNWALGLAAAYIRLSFRKFLLVTACAFAFVTAVSIAQVSFFPHALYFFKPANVVGEALFTHAAREARGVDSWKPLDALYSIVVTSAVAPKAVVEHLPHDTVPHSGLTNQGRYLSAQEPLGLLSAAAWLACLGLGLYGAWRSRHRWRIAVCLSAYLIFQIVLHLVYGEITFLYALDFFPAMVGLVMFAWFTPLRTLALAAGVVFIVAGGLHNAQRFREAAQVANYIANVCDGMCKP